MGPLFALDDKRKEVDGDYSLHDKTFCYCYYHINTTRGVTVILYTRVGSGEIQNNNVL